MDDFIEFRDALDDCWWKQVEADYEVYCFLRDN